MGRGGGGQVGAGIEGKENSLGQKKNPAEENSHCLLVCWQEQDMRPGQNQTSSA